MNTTKNHYISIKGAREHNLDNLSLEIPRNKLIVITGLSGSGKSSLAFDTIYAEGQRRYVESLSAYARQFLEMMQKPDVDSIEGLSPAISIEQKTTSKNPRSTVGTVTEIYDYMRLLWARVGIPYSPATGKPISSQTVSQMVDNILDLKENSRLYILSPIVRGRKGEYKKELSELLQKGFSRVCIDGEYFELENTPALDKNKKHDISILVDRLKLDKTNDTIKTRIADSIETALSLNDGIIYLENLDNKEKIIFSSKFACPVSGFTIDEIEPRLFSFNNPFGACPKCDGLGVILNFDKDLIIPDHNLSLRDGAILPWSNTKSKYYLQTLEALSKHYNFSLDVPYKKLENKIHSILLYGSQKEKIKIIYTDNNKSFSTFKSFEGLIPNLTRRYIETESNWIRDELEKFRKTQICQDCQGKRLKKESLSVKINKKDISDITKYSIIDALNWFLNLEQNLNETDIKISQRILKEIINRLKFLINVGLKYLNLSRNSGTLSGGEAQRIRLASQIGSGLTGVLYVLDEPSIGLHQRDNSRLISTLTSLRDLGNTVIVVEHDEESIKYADFIIDMGPGAGINGGKIVAKGSFSQIITNKKSITGDYLSGRRQIDVPISRKKLNNNLKLKIHNASGNNLKNISVEFPLKTLICVTGVSGGGKSTLVIETLWKALSNKLNNSKLNALYFKKIEGIEFLDKVVDINQSPIGRTPRSNPATYTGTFTPIRDWYSGLPESKSRGYLPGRFSFNVKGGRCEECQGDGVKKIEMHFLPDVYVTCDLCKGKRYNRETLEIKWRNKSISDVLEMTVEEGIDFFKAIPSIRDKLLTMSEVGLNYIKIGQQATTLSGGEAQRIKLSKELSKRATGKTIYILDEPTTGLHFEDIKNLLRVLHKLVDSGNTVIIIEHNLDVIKTADWVIDLGPEGGDEGGEIVSIGTPEQIANDAKSYTGKYLNKVLKNTDSYKFNG